MTGKRDIKRLVQSIEAVIFDMDGVLVDTEPVHIESFKHYMDELNLSYDEQLLHSFIGYSIAHNVQTINRMFLPGREIPVDEGVEHRDKIYISLINEQPLTPIPGVIDLIDYCLNNDIKLGLASSSSNEQVDIILKKLSANPNCKFHFHDLFQSIVSGDDAEHKKPAPDIYLKTLNDLNLPGIKCLAIEDSSAGVQSAKAAGLNCFALRNPFADENKLSGADVVVDSILEVIELFVERNTYKY